MGPRLIKKTQSARVCAIVLLFIVAATLSAIRKDVAQCFDEEPTHPMHLQHSGKRWPAFEDLRMPGLSGFYFTSEANHLEATGFFQIVSYTPRRGLSFANAIVQLHLSMRPED